MIVTKPGIKPGLKCVGGDTCKGSRLKMAGLAIILFFGSN